MYRWDGQIREDQEIRARHPYDVPEVLALPVVRGADTYLDWVRQATAE